MKDIKILLKRNVLWVLFIGFAIIGLVTKEDASVFLSQGPYSFGKYILWLLFFSFLGYTIYCSSKENFFKSVQRICQMYWGRQISIDLYIGLLLPLLIIFLHSGTLVFLIWVIPVLINANLFILLYLALNYDSLIAQFLG